MSVVIPARNEQDAIGGVVAAVLDQVPAGVAAEVIVVDDGSSDGTAARAAAAGARVVARKGEGNPAAARNLGASVARGDPIVFLDADCTPLDGWLVALLSARARGESCTGGSLALPAGLPATARWDYYCGWYHVHPARPRAAVPNLPPCNLSVRAELFARTAGFTERQPIAYSHEELEWQAEIQRQGHLLHFEPRAAAAHHNRPGLGNLLARNYRWGYCAIESKAGTGVARFAAVYRYPRLLVLLSLPLAPVQAAYIIGCWLRAGVWEPLLVFPIVLLARFAYASGMTIGALRWLRRRPDATPATPRWT